MNRYRFLKPEIHCFWLVGLAETLYVRESAIKRPDHEGYRSLPQEECERTREHRIHRVDAQNDIELARKDPMPQLPPSAPFEGKIQRIKRSCQRLVVKVIFKDPTQTPGIEAIEPRHPDHLDRAKRRLCAAHRILTRRPHSQRDVMELGERGSMRKGDIGMLTCSGLQSGPNTRTRNRLTSDLLRTLPPALATATGNMRLAIVLAAGRETSQPCQLWV